MTLFIYAVLGLTVTWALYLLYVHIATRATEGRPADPLFALFPALVGERGRALVYCYSPQCGPCRSMSKEVELVVAEGSPVYKLDVTAHADLSHELGIRAIPTLIVIEDGTIGRMLLGVKTAGYMRNLLTPATQ